MVCRPLTPLRLTGALSPLVRLALEPAGTLDCCREHVCQILLSRSSSGRHVQALRQRRLAVDVIVERCAGLDVHKKTVMAAVRTPGTAGKRREVVREFSTYNEGLVALRAWLVAEGATKVVMEATGVYWRPVWHVLEEEASLELLLANARHVKNLPGRKTDVADAGWLAQLLECGLLRGSFVPPKDIARLRDLTRYRTNLVRERAREVQRLQKLLEDALLTELVA